MALCVFAQATGDSDDHPGVADRSPGGPRGLFDRRQTATAPRLTAELDLTERNGRLQVSSSMRLAADLTPLEFSVKGKSYRFVNVDAAVKVVGGVATVTNLGETKTFEAPRRFFTAQSYAPLSARAQLINYWEQARQAPDPAGDSRRANARRAHRTARHRYRLAPLGHVDPPPFFR